MKKKLKTFFHSTYFHNIKRSFISLFLALFLLASVISIVIIDSKQTLINKDKAAVNQIYWGAYIDYGNTSAPWTISSWDKFEKDAGKKVSILHFGQAWKDGSGNFQSFSPTLMNSVRSRGAIPMIDWGSWKIGAGANQPDFKLTSITSGNYDTYIKQWATDAKIWGKPMFLRFDHEMNIGGQFPWNFADGVNTASDYVNMWRHVRDIFTQVGATNVTWVWCPNIYYLSGSNAKPFMQAYPGDSYVDWTALDGYNAGNNWDSFSTVFSDSYNVLSGKVAGIAGAPNKPIMLGEWASNEAGDGGSKKAAWINDALQTQLPNNFPNIKAVVWFNWNAGTENWIIESSSQSQSAFKQSISSSYYAANDFASLDTSPIQPLSPIVTITPTLTTTTTPTSTITPTITTVPVTTSILPQIDDIFPVISITTPNKSTVTRNTNQNIVMNASDNVAVSKVLVYINNLLICTITTSPYQCTWKVPSKPNQFYSIKGVAYDAAGNSSSTEIKVQSK